MMIKKVSLSFAVLAGALLLSYLPLAAADSGSNTINLEVRGPGQVNVEVTVPGSGDLEENFICTDVCNFQVSDDRRVTLDPIPKEQALFLRWDDFCIRSVDRCSFTFDPGITGETINIKANFEFINNKKPYLKKTKALTSKALLVKTGCGGTHECSLRLTGYLRGAKPKRINIEPIFFDLVAGEKRTLNIIAGSDNAAIRKAISKKAKNNSRARLFVQLTDVITQQTQGMAINEKPRCCFDNPGKPNKPNN